MTRQTPGSDLPQRFLTHATERGLLPAAGPLLVAVSGGLDSIALLHLILETFPNKPLIIIHINHGLRGEASDADAALVEDVGAKAGVPVVIRQLEGRALKEEGRGIGIQAAARAARYRIFEEERRSRGAAVIATAHTLTDQAETVLGRVLTGTGLTGLKGIPETRGSIIRPLLPFSRDEVREYAGMRGLRWREDPSNQDQRYERARLRHAVLPVARELVNPRVDEALAYLARLATRDAAFIEDEVSRRLEATPWRGGEGRVERQWLSQQPPAVQSRVIRRMLKKSGLTEGRLGRRHVEAVMAYLAANQVRISLPQGLVLEDVGGWLEVKQPATRPGPSMQPRSLVVPGLTSLPSAGIVVEGTAPFPVPPPGRWRVPPDRCLLDARVLDAGLHIRTPKPGDRFFPLGGVGSKKLSDFLIDAKVPRDLRAQQPLVLSGDEIVWIVGLRTSEVGRLGAQSVRAIELVARRASDS